MTSSPRNAARGSSSGRPTFSSTARQPRTTNFRLHLLDLIKTKCPGNVVYGWKLSKVHATFIRAPDHINEFGATRHSSTEVVERLVKTSAKAPSGNTNRQTTVCHLDASHLIDEAVQFILEQDPRNLGAERSYRGETVDRPSDRTQYIPRPPQWTKAPAGEYHQADFHGLAIYKVGYFEGRCRAVWSRTKSKSHMEAPEMVVNKIGAIFFDHPDKEDEIRNRKVARGEEMESEDGTGGNLDEGLSVLLRSAHTSNQLGLPVRRRPSALTAVAKFPAPTTSSRQSTRQRTTKGARLTLPAKCSSILIVG